MHWYLYSIASALLIGVFVALFKIPSYKGYNGLAVLSCAFLASGLLAIGLFHASFSETSIGVLVCAFLWGASFAIASAVQVRAHKYVDVGFLSPFTSSVGLGLTVVLGTFFFRDHLSAFAWAGVALVVLTVAFLSERKKRQAGNGPAASVLFLISAIIALGVFNTFLVKYEVRHFSIQAIQLYQYFFALLMTLALVPLTQKSAEGHGSLSISRKDLRLAAPWGIALGTLSVFGGYLFYLSVQAGPFAIVNAINSLYIIVTVVVAAILFKEKLTAKRLLLAVLALAAVILMQF